MKINYGLSDGAVLQRDENGFCSCVFSAESRGEILSNIGEVKSLGGDKYFLTGLEAGGKYTLELWDSADKITLNIWVGDVWLLGGQSNMEGAGCFTESDLYDEKNPDENIRAYYSDNHWGEALPMLHEPWSSAYACQAEVWKKSQLQSNWKSDKPEFISHGVPKRGIGPGLAFAKKIYELSGGVPQAVIPCALGGAGMYDWRPEAENGLYSAMIDRLKKIGGNVRGMFWYQGCSDAHSDGIEKFNDNMVDFIKNVRRECNNNQLPVVQVQIAKTNHPSICNSFENGLNWMDIREKQRTMHTLIPYMDTVSAIDSDYDDLIHLSSASQRQIGARGALSMAKLCGIGGKEAIKLKRMYITEDEFSPFWAVLNIEYENADNLISAGVPSGFAIADKSDEMLFAPNLRIARVRLCGNTVKLYTEYSKDDLKDKYVSYCYLNMGYCNITDESGHALPAMGPLNISECLN